jgi:hypothetical protein
MEDIKSFHEPFPVSETIRFFLPPAVFLSNYPID